MELDELFSSNNIGGRDDTKEAVLKEGNLTVDLRISVQVR
jgi:hypothetical protein